jgi:hypothetical protein
MATYLFAPGNRVVLITAAAAPACAGNGRPIDSRAPL